MRKNFWVERTGNGNEPSEGFDIRYYERAAQKARDQRARLARGGPLGLSRLPATTRRILAFTWLSLIFTALYSFFIGASLVQPGYTWVDRIASALLLLGLFFVSVHGFGYANSMLKALWGHQEHKRTRWFLSAARPRVMCVVASFNEPPDVLEDTISALCALDYPNKEIVLLDDSTLESSRNAARAICERYGVKCVQRDNRRGFKAGAINDFLPQTDAQYVAFFDADALPVASFLREVVPHLDENPRLAFVQTPQFYANTQVSHVALGASRQQNVFYEYICEGKSYSGAMFCCGTNVIFRKGALESVGGFDEKNVTEDFATSFEMHRAGWDSLYLNRVFVYSLAPENLAAYFTQQSRWALGTLIMARSMLREFLKNPRALRVGQWWEYFLSATYYWSGFVNLIFLCLPLATIFFDIKPLRQDALTYIAVFVPYFLFTLNMFYTGMEARGYKLGETVLGQQLGFITFPIHVSAAVSALLGRKKPFRVTPKGVSGRIPWMALWPQLLFLILSGVAFVWGVWLYISGVERSSTAILINSAWALYHVWMLRSIFQLNQPVRLEATKKQFFVRAGEARIAPPVPLEGVRNPLRLSRVLGLVSVLTISGVVGVVATVAAWNATPRLPVNVYVVDRTFGPRGQENRAFFWTLSHLRATREKGFGPPTVDGERAAGPYDRRLDLYGFVFNPNAKPGPDPQRDQNPEGDDLPVAFGLDNPLPRQLQTPGVVALLDTYGEFTERLPDGKIVRRRAQRRGLLFEEIARLEDFAARGGVVVAEWNTLGYPTKPGAFVPPQDLDRALNASRQRIRSWQANDLVRARRAQLLVEKAAAARRAASAAASGSASGSISPADRERISVARGRVADVRGAIDAERGHLRGLQERRFPNAVAARQAEAAQNLEKLLGVRSLGWYGRFVADFGDEKIYDPALYRNVRDDLRRRTKNAAAEPSGPGFVFYPAGPSERFNPKTGRLERSPVGRPVAILGADLPSALTGELATIVRINTDSALLEGVGDEIPARIWFDLVEPREDGRVLMRYQFQIAPAAGDRLVAAGFPKRFLSKNGAKIVMPALVVREDGAGKLRGLYFAGDVSDTGAISSFARRAPALGQIDRLLAARGGSFQAQFYWNYYFPIWRNLLRDPQVQYRRVSE